MNFKEFAEGIEKAPDNFTKQLEGLAKIFPSVIPYDSTKISITTSDIILTDDIKGYIINFGPFLLTINVYILFNDLKYYEDYRRIIVAKPLKPNYSRVRVGEARSHPHIFADKFCLGGIKDKLSIVARNKDLFSFCLILHDVCLNTDKHMVHSSYSIHEWANEITCFQCGEEFFPNTNSKCNKCKANFCKKCGGFCSINKKYYCSKCSFVNWNKVWYANQHKSYIRTLRIQRIRELSTEASISMYNGKLYVTTC